MSSKRDVAYITLVNSFLTLTKESLNIGSRTKSLFSSAKLKSYLLLSLMARAEKIAFPGLADFSFFLWTWSEVGDLPERTTSSAGIKIQSLLF